LRDGVSRLYDFPVCKRTHVAAVPQRWAQK